VALDLEGIERAIEDRTRLLEEGDREVRDGDVVDEAAVAELVERRQSLAGVVLAGRPADVQQVEPVEPQSARLRSAAAMSSSCARLSCHTLDATNSSSRSTGARSMPAPTAASLPYIRAVSTWR
jgi:hypothetical protein